MSDRKYDNSRINQSNYYSYTKNEDNTVLAEFTEGYWKIASWMC